MNIQECVIHEIGKIKIYKSNICKCRVIERINYLL